jgi:hypothetical protein
MSAVWITIAVLFAVTAAFKAAGPLAVGGRRLPDRLAHAVGLLAPALLAGLVVYETLAPRSGAGLAPDARLGGLAVAVLALALRAPLLLVVALAALATALIRLIA